MVLLVEKWVSVCVSHFAFQFLPVFNIWFFCFSIFAEKINCRRYILFAFECSQIGNFLREIRSSHLDILCVCVLGAMPNERWHDIVISPFAKYTMTTRCVRAESESRSVMLMSIGHAPTQRVHCAPIITIIIMCARKKYLIESNEYILVTLFVVRNLFIHKILVSPQRALSKCSNNLVATATVAPTNER